MLRLEFIHTADCHLGYVPGNLPPDRPEDFKRAFSSIVDYAVERSSTIRLFLIAGDLFDSHNPGRQWVEFVNGELTRLLAKGITPVMIAGTHDGIGYPDSVFRTGKFSAGTLLLDSATPDRPVTRTVGDVPVHFYGMSWTPGQSRRPFDKFEATDDPGFHIAILHGALDTADNWEAEERDVPVRLENLQKTGVDYVALGHYHRKQVHPGPVTVAYPGNIEGKRFGEEGPRYFLHVVLGDGKEADITPVECQQRALRNIEVPLSGLAADDQTALAGYLKTLAEPRDIVRFTLDGDPGFPVDPDELRNDLSGYFYHVEIKDRSSFTTAASVLAAREENTVRGMFVRRMLGLIENAGHMDERRKLELALREGFRAFGEAG
jgi:DNA repair exonuclease SbcCD nuclease subunit